MASPPPVIKKRRDFLAAAKGKSLATASFVMQKSPSRDLKAIKYQQEANTSDDRFGYTVTKKMGNAVVRNRLKRRLREALRVSQISKSQEIGDDFVLIGRPSALTVEFSALCSDMQHSITTLKNGGGKIRTMRRKKKR